MGSPLEQYISSRPPTQAPTSSPLEDYLGKKASQVTDDTGFMSYLGHVAENFIKTEYVKSNMQNPLSQIAGAIHPSFGYNPDPNSEEGRIKGAIEKGGYTSFEDWMNGFKQMWDNTGTAVKDAINHPRAVIGGLKDVITNPASIGKGIFQPAIDAAELSSGVSLTGNDIQALDPVEKATRVRDMVAFGAATAVGGGVSGLFERVAGKTALEGSLALRLAKGASTGVAAGGTYSAVNQQDADQIITSALLGGGLGALLGSGRSGEIKGPDVAKVREMQPETNSIASQVSVINSALSSNDAADIIVKGKVALQPNIPWRIPGISFNKVTELEKSVPEGFKSEAHINTDGTVDLLVYNPDEVHLSSDPISLKGSKSAIRKDGEVFTGATHEDAVEAAMAKGYKPDDLSSFEMGWVRPGGKWISSGFDHGNNAIPGAQVEIDDGFFRRTGFMKGEQVRYLGKDNWSIQDSVGEDVTLRNESDGTTLDVPKSEVVSGIQGSIGHLNDAIRDNLYEEWQSTIPENLDPYKTLGLPEPKGVKDIIPEIEDLAMQKHMDGFLKSKGFADNQLSVVRRQLQAKLSEESGVDLSPGDKQIINENKLTEALPPIQDFNNLQLQAKSNGFDVTDDLGRIIVRDLDTGSAIKGFNTIKEATDFINKAGKKVGPVLDQNIQFDTGAASGSPPIPPDGGTPVYGGDDEGYNHAFSNDQLAKSNWGESFWKFGPGLQDVSFLTKYRDYLVNQDRKFGTNLSTKFTNLYTLRNKAAGMTEVPIKELRGIQRGLAANPKAFKNILGYIRSGSADEIGTRFNQTERNLGKTISDAKVNVKSIFDYQKAFDKLQKQYPDSKLQSDPRLQERYVQDQRRIQAENKIGPKELQVAELFNNIRGLPNENVSLGNVLRYSRALDNPMSKADFVKTHNISGKEIIAANQLLDQMTRLKKDLGIKADIYDILDHAKNYDSSKNVKAALSDFVATKGEGNYEKLIRAGALNADDENPFKIQLRTIKGAMDVLSGFHDAVDGIDHGRASDGSDLNSQIDNIRNQGFKGNADKAKSVFMRMVADMRGVPAVSESALRENTQLGLGKFGMKDGRVVDNVTHTIGRLINFKYLDGRAQLGISHFFTSYGLGIAGRSVEYMNRVVKSGFEAVRHNEAEIDRLKQKGVFRGNAPYSAFTPDADVNALGSRVGEVIDKAEDIGFKATLLPTIYDGLVAGHYLTTEADVLSGLKDLSDGKINQEQFAKKLFLTKYDVPIIDQFNKLAEHGRPTDAAHYLAMNAVEDLVGTYGKGNTPYGWGTGWGSLLGQYGQFSRFKWAAISRLVTRGTIGERMTAAAKLGAIHLAFKELSDKSGMNFMKLDPLYDMFWIKSVAVSTGEDVAQALNGYGLEQKLAEGRLKKQFNPFSMGFMPNVVQDITNGIEDIGAGNIGTGSAELLGFRKTAEAEVIMIGRWRALPPTKILRKYINELKDRVVDMEKTINELRWEKKAILERINWIEKRIEKENGP